MTAPPAVETGRFTCGHDNARVADYSDLRMSSRPAKVPFLFVTFSLGT